MVAGASSARAAGHGAGTGCETVHGHFYLSGFHCFLGSGGRAFKQHVVSCVNPILQRCGNGAAS